MPGILGIVSPRNPRSCVDQLHRMLASVKHEDFYRSGTYVNAMMGVYLGWTCLAGSPNDCLPVVSRRKDIVLLISGEVSVDRSYSSSRQTEECDSDVGGLGQVLCTYEQKGEQWVSGLNGCFAGALVDLRFGRFYLFNDRYGMERIFVHDVTGDLYFASEAKALLAVVPDTRSFDLQGLGEFLACGCTLGTRSLYRNIGVMPAASLLRAEDKSLTSRTVYFRPTSWLTETKLEAGQFLNALSDTLPPIVRRVANAECPVAISLTGGLDSRVLLACLDPSAVEYASYTFGSMMRDTRDVIVARKAAEECGYTHTVLTLGREFLQNFPTYMEQAVYRSDGYCGLSGAAELYLNSLARGIALIRLTGNYGSELLRGVRAFKAVIPNSKFLAGDYAPQIQRAVRSFRELEGMDPVSFTLFCQAPNQGFGRLAVEKSQVVMRTPFLDDEFTRLMYLRPPECGDGTELYASVIRRCRPGLMNIATDRGELGTGTRITRAVRSAFRRAVIKGEYWASHGMPQWLAAVTALVPWVFPVDVFLGQDKFQHYRRWFAAELSGDVRDFLISHAVASTVLDKNSLAAMIRDHVKGIRNHEAGIGTAMTIAIVERVLLAPQAFPHRGYDETSAFG